MKLVVNATRVPFQQTGIFRYAKILIDTLELLNFELYTLRSNKDLNIKGTIIDIPAWLYNHRKSKLFPVYWYWYALFVKVPRDSPIISVTQHLLPFKKNQIISLLDMRPYHAPDTILQKIYAKFLFPLSTANIRAVITISEASKDEIAKLYQIEKNLIHVVYLYPEISKPTTGNKSHQKPYLLMIGASFKHKNLHLALENHKSWSDRYKLVVIASDNKYTQDMRRLADNFGISESVEFKFKAVDEEKETLLREAAALLYISNMEGFGIPPLEAMCYGTPCILSQIPVLQELYSNAALFFDPNVSSNWDLVIAQLENNPLLDQIISAGYQRVEAFSPERTREMLKRALTIIFDK